MKRHVWQIGIAMTALLLSGVACGPSAQAPAQQQPAATSGSDTPHSGGIVKARIKNDPFDWDTSYVGKSVPNDYGTSLAYDGLVAFKAGPDVPYGENQMVPALAESWQISPDGTTYTFHLRKGVHFANLPPVNGREVTSADVKFSYEYSSRTGEFAGGKLPKGQYEWMFEGMQSVEAPDPYTVVVRFERPFAPFLGYTGSTKGNPIMAREIYEADGDFHDQIVGTGPFQLDQADSQKGTVWVWKKNPTYREAGKPYLDAVQWLTLPDDGSAFAAFNAKQLDLIGFDIAPESADQIKGQNPDAVQYQFTKLGAGQLYINTREAPFNDLRIRKALSLGIDREEFVQARTEGRGMVGMAGNPAGVYFTEEEIKQLMPYKPDEARQLVKEAGYPDGLTVEMTYPGTAYGDAYITDLQLLQAQLAKVGINLELKSEDKSSFSDNRKKGKFTINYIANASLDGDTDSWLYSTWYPGSKANYNGVNDPRVKDLLDQEVAATDPAKRKQIIRDAIKYINTDQYWGVSIYYGVDYNFWQPRLKNYAPNFWNPGYPLKDSWVER